jgi:hypothetical protein
MNGLNLQIGRLVAMDIRHVHGAAIQRRNAMLNVIYPTILSVH